MCLVKKTESLRAEVTAKGGVTPVHSAKAADTDEFTAKPAPTNPTPANPAPVKPGHVTLTDSTGAINYKMPILPATAGPSVIDIRGLYADTGLFTYDPGYTSTSSCQSAITFIDGKNGILLYRGYPIEDLARRSDYPEVCYLLLSGELPSKSQKKRFLHTLTYHTMVHEQMISFYKGFRRDAHPMAIMVGVVGALSAFYTDKQYDFSTPHGHWVAVSRLIAKMPTVAAMAYKYSIGQPFVYPRNDLSYSENFLYMMFGLPAAHWKISPVQVRAMDQLLILHADHEQNASTSTVRLAGSSGANPFACIAAGIASLWGPAHGGANEAVLKMLGEIGGKNNVQQYIKRAKDPNDAFRLMGFGHRVYKNYDPRASVIRETCLQMLGEVSKKDPLLDLALELERIALEDDYFVSRKLFPNVDFYSGILLRAMGLPTSMFTAFFAVARTVGWIAQWKEMSEEPVQKIGRPRQLYIGPKQRTFIPLDKRPSLTKTPPLEE